MILTKTEKGYSHIKSGKPCQDFSAKYHDEERDIITVCDGHGGDSYVRSDRGSKFASRALIKILADIKKNELRRLKDQKALDQIKLNVLCEWNSLVEKDLKEHPLRKSELKDLDEMQINALKNNPVKAYGTTMLGAMIFNNKIIAVQIGDGGAFFIQKKGHIFDIFKEDEDEPVANITYSMCQEDAYDYIKIGMFELTGIDGVLLCTDGVVNPYQNYDNFEKSFVCAMVKDLKQQKYKEISDFIVSMGKEKGNGDDVSLAVYYKK